MSNEKKNKLNILFDNLYNSILNGNIKIVPACKGCNCGKSDWLPIKMIFDMVKESNKKGPRSTLLV